MVDAITKYRNKITSPLNKEKRLIPEREYIEQDYSQETLNLIYKFNLEKKPKFKHLIKAFSKIELLDDDNFYKEDLKKFWKSHFNGLFGLYWNNMYKVEIAREKKQKDSIENWRERLGIKKESSDPIDIRMNLMNRNGVELSAINNFSSSTSADYINELNQNKNEDDLVVNQAPDPELLNFINDGESSKVKKSKISADEQNLIDAKKVKPTKEKSKLSWFKKALHKSKVESTSDEKKEDKVDLLADVDLSVLVEKESNGLVSSDFFTKQFNDNVINEISKNIDIDKFNVKNKSRIQHIKMNVLPNSNDQSKYSLWLNEENDLTIIPARENNGVNKKQIIRADGNAKPKINNDERLIDLKEKLLKDLKKELNYKKAIYKLNYRNEKILNKAKKEAEKIHMNEVNERRRINKETLKKYEKISTKAEEVKLDRLLTKKSNSKRVNIKFKDLANKELSLEEQQKMYEIDSEIIESRKEIALLDSKLNKKSK